MTTLTDQIAVVTGSSSGVGKALALGLAAQGTRLCLVGRNADRLKEVAEQARVATHWVKSYRVDLESEKEIVEFARRLKEDVGRVDILIHSAGIIATGTIDRAPVENLDRQYAINVRAPYLLTQTLLPLMRASQGQIVFINSSAGINARATVGQYAITKHALKAMADSLREEVNPDGVRVLSVFLGRTDSPMQEAVHKTEGRSYHPEFLIRPEDVTVAVITSLSVTRNSEVTDIHIRPLKKL